MAQYSSGIIADAVVLIKQLRSFLKKYTAADMFREIVQNADDACATTLIFCLLEQGGGTEVNHPLLRGPALLVYNDGPLEKKDVKGILELIGGSKQEDDSKIGRFGLGLKSLFHVCEGFFFDAFPPESSTAQGYLFDPWEPLRTSPREGAHLREWSDVQCKEALDHIQRGLRTVTEVSANPHGFVLYIPLRSKAWTDEWTSITTQTYTCAEFFDFMISNIQQLFLSLAQCAHLQTLTVFRAVSLNTLREKQQLYKAVVVNPKNRLSRHTKGDSAYEGCFSCKIQTFWDTESREAWHCTGLESFVPNALQEIVNSADWPDCGIDPHLSCPAKAVPHAAVTVLRNEHSVHIAQPGSICMRWASFLPFDDGPAPRIMAERIAFSDMAIKSDWNVLLHGYFWPSDDRKSLPGLTSLKEKPSAEERWNRELARQILLPLLPNALEQALIGRSVEEQRAFVRAVKRWEFYETHKDCICANRRLVRVVSDVESACQWKTTSSHILTIPEGFPAEVGHWLAGQQGVTACLRDEGLYELEHVQVWSDTLFAGLFAVFAKAKSLLRQDVLEWIRNFLRMRELENSAKVLSQAQKDVLGEWCIKLVLNRVFQEKSFVSVEVQKGLIDIATTFMRERIFLFPKKTELALKALASEIMTPRYVLLPSADIELSGNLPHEERKRLLYEVCKELTKPIQQEAYIALADRLCPTEHDPEFDDMPMYRVTVFTDGRLKDAAKSYRELQKQSAQHLVFLASPKVRFVDREMYSLSASLDSGVEVWRIADASTVPSGIPLGTEEEALWQAVLQNQLSPDPQKRHEFIEFTKNYILSSETACAAVRALLAGKKVDDTIRFVISGKSQTVIPKLAKRFLAIKENQCEFLSREEMKKLKVVEPHAVAAEQLVLLLSSTDAWQDCSAILEVYDDLKDIPQELYAPFLGTPWIPADRGHHGYAPKNILHLRNAALQSLLADSLPADWTTRKGIVETEKIAGVLDTLGRNERDEDQLHRLFDAQDFYLKTPLLPAGLQVDDTLLNWLKEISPPQGKDRESDLLQHLLALPQEIALKGLQKCCGTGSAYAAILSAACRYYTNECKVDPPQMLAAYIDALHTEQDTIFTTDTRFPTRKPGMWKTGDHIACTDTGYDDEYLLEKHTWALCSGRLKAAMSPVTAYDMTEHRYRDSADVLRLYFDAEISRSDRYRLAVFVTLLAGNNAYVQQFGATLLEKNNQNSEQWQNEIREAFDEEVWNYGLSVRNSKDEHASMLKALSGTPFKEKANVEKGFITSAVNKPNSSGGMVREIVLHSDANGRCLATNKESFKKSLKASFFWWGKYVGLNPQTLDKLWEEHSETQVSLAETRNILRNDLHVLLAQFKLDKNLHLSTLLMDLREVHATMSAGNTHGGNQNARKKDELQTRLWDAALKESAIYTALIDKIHEMGYRVESALLELLQNADDALRDVAKMYPTPPCTDVDIELHGRTLLFTHHGRPINDRGRDRVKAWSYDLYNMIVLNQSQKPNDHQVSTGKLGLGFKSVHLLCHEPKVQSADLCFCIKNGMFPVEIEKPFAQDDTGKSTIFKLDLRGNVLDQLFKRFDAAGLLLPVFAKQIRQIRVNRNGKVAYYSFEPSPLGESGWEKDDKNGILCFCDPKTDVSLAMGWTNGLPTPLPSTIPKLWHTLPTESGEDWEIRYALNGPFHVDPGRVHIAFDESDARLCEKFGEALGEALCRYSDYVAEHDSQNVARHTTALWSVLATGLADIPAEASRRQTLLKALHTQGRGLSCWLKHRPVVGHGLPESWSVPVPNSSGVWYESSYVSLSLFACVMQDLAEHAGWAGLAVVTPQKGKVLRFLEYVVKTCDDAEIYRHLFERGCKDNKLTPEIFHLIAQLGDHLPANLNYAFTVRTAAGSFCPIKEVLMPESAGKFPGISDYKDEFLRAPFAPEKNRLHDDYIHEAIHVAGYVKLRSSLNADAQTLAEWIDKCESPYMRDHALKYLNTGSLRSQVIATLGQHYPHSWVLDHEILNEYAAIENIAMISFQLCPERWSCAGKVSGAAASLSQATAAQSVEPVNAESLLQKWKNNKAKIQQNYIKETWPHKFHDQASLKALLENKNQEAWLVLLLLGYLQGLGRTKPAAHRNFINGLPNTTLSKLAGHDARWINVLCGWQDKSVQNLEYREHMTCFPALHQLNRYIDQYMVMFKNIPAMLKSDSPFESLFVPRASGVQSGSGKHTDAPPLPLNIGKYWVLRELARLNVWNFQEKELLFPYCWVPREACLRRVGIFDGKSDNDVENQRLVETLTTDFGTLPTFDYWFDIALCAKEPE